MAAGIGALKMGDPKIAKVGGVNSDARSPFSHILPPSYLADS